jgi:hypothetical protein
MSILLHCARVRHLISLFIRLTFRMNFKKVFEKRAEHNGCLMLQIAKLNLVILGG